MAAIVHQQKNSAPPTTTTKKLHSPMTISSGRYQRGPASPQVCPCEPQSFTPSFQPREPLGAGGVVIRPTLTPRQVHGR